MIRKDAKVEDKTGVKVTFVELLEKSGVITKEALKSALAEQWERGGTLEEILVEKGFLNEEQLVKFILDSFPMLHYVSLKDIDIDPDAVEHIPSRIARKYLVIPIRKKGKSLAVAMANPINREMLAELKNVTDLKIRPFISKVSEIKEAIEKYYAESESVEKISEPFTGAKTKREIGVLIAKDKTFDSFIVDETNKHAFLLCKDIAETRGVGEKKVFLFGPDGCGKSHLLQSIANYILENEALRRFIYIDAYKFYSTIKELKTEREVDRYIEILSDVDIILFDDLDFLVGKDFAQDALLTVLSDLISRDKQAVITSAYPLKNMPTLNRKLKQLLTEFMTIGIEEPSADLKRKVARMFAGEEGLPSSVIDQIASKPGLNLKKIETIVRELLTYKRLGERIDENLINKVIGAFIEAGK
uniref:Chromosomal replication initiator protein DnaA n=1 Tax=candidate division WOR-3 bacterium TaxID=2052148 RepID=A0A7V3ZXA5_UNCW3